MMDGEDISGADVAPDEAADAGGDNAAPQLSEVEQLAADMGWDPAYKGTDAKPARTAAEWIKSTDRMNRNLRSEVASLKSSVERIVSATDKQVKREVERRAQEIGERFAQAVDAKDTAAAAAAAQEMRELETEAKAQPSGPRNYEADFARDNPWYNKDKAATAYAIMVANEEAAKGSPAEEQLRAAAAAVRERFPDLMPDGQRKPDPKPQASVHAPGRGAPARKTLGFADMPEIAKQAANRFYEAAQMRGTAQDRKAYEAQYAKDYFSGQAA